MATEKTFSLSYWYGLNESEDGDTKLKMGEASVCQNWKVTRDKVNNRSGGNLRRRFGTKSLWNLSDVSVDGLWSGFINGVEHFLAVTNGKMYELNFVERSTCTYTEIGEIRTDGRVTFFPFNSILYILTGVEYYQYDGNEIIPVVGYRPLVATATPPTGGGTLLEQVNKLNGMRRQWFSPDGEHDEFTLAENDLTAIDYVSYTINDVFIDPSMYTVDKLNGKITFNNYIASFTYDEEEDSRTFTVTNTDATHYVLGALQKVTLNSTQLATDKYTYENNVLTIDASVTLVDNDKIDAYLKYYPITGTNTIEIGYSAAATYREEITKMRYFELYAGQTSTRVLVYGDGTNRFIYSSLDYWGIPRADYFPDLNETALGDSNTRITGMVRHYSNLIVFKETEAYSLQYSLVSDAEGDNIEAFYGKTINSAVGNIADGMIVLVDNSPRSIYGKDVFEWKNTSAYSSNLTIDERQAKRISDRIFSTLGTFDLANCYCFNDKDHQEYYICNPTTKEALINNYVTDTWYKYTNFDMRCACMHDGDIFFGTQDGKVKHFSDFYYNDDEQPINALWQSGSLAFEAPQMRKFMSKMFVTIKPESHGYLKVSVITDKKAAFKRKEVESSLFDFDDVDFANLSFETNRMPKTHKVKLKAKKFVYMCIILETQDDASSATVTDITIPIRYSGYAK